jgi:RNA polymerase sigma-32 factor
MGCRDERAQVSDVGAEYEKMPLADELAMVRAAQSGDKRSQDKLWRHIYRYLVRLAHQCAALARHPKAPTVRGHVTPEDLLGVFGVVFMEVLERFDADRGLRFLTYATYWFRAGAQSFTGRISRGERAVRQAMAQAHAEGVRLSADELAEQCGVRGSTVERTMISLRAHEVSFDAPVCGTAGQEETHRSTLADELDMGEPTTEEQLIACQETRRRTAALRRAMRSLSWRERQILENHMADEPKSYRAMESTIGVTYERIRQIDHATREMVRAHLEQELGDGFGPAPALPAPVMALPKKPPSRSGEAGQLALLFVDG